MSDATELLRVARRRIGDAYVLGAKVPQGNPNWRGPWDCAEFTSWCVFQVTGELVGCRPTDRGPDVADAYTGFWAEDAKRARAVVPVAEAVATRGAFLLRVAEGGSQGHIVISAGDGTTVEAHSSRRGVIAGSVDGRRWHMGIVLESLRPSAADAPAPVPARRPRLVLRVRTPFMTGDLVKAVQRRLKDLGFHAGPIDGVYGPQTAAAVQAFQASRRMLVDGEAGAATGRALGIEWP